MYSVGLDPQTLMAMFECLPKDFKIVGFGHDAFRTCCFWTIESKEFEPVPMHNITPYMNVKWTKDNGYLRCKILEGESNEFS
jgi:hypothetical protein